MMAVLSIQTGFDSEASITLFRNKAPSFLYFLFENGLYLHMAMFLMGELRENDD